MLNWQVFFPFRNIGAVIKLGLLPILLCAIVLLVVLFAFLVVNNLTGEALPTEESKPELLPVKIIGEFITFCFGSMIAVSIHRYIIIDTPARWLNFRFRKYELFYILTNIAIYASAFAVFVTTEMVIYNLFYTDGFPLRNQEHDTYRLLLVIILFLFCTSIYAKFGLALPHAAITGHIAFVTAWTA